LRWRMAAANSPDGCPLFPSRARSRHVGIGGRRHWRSRIHRSVTGNQASASGEIRDHITFWRGGAPMRVIEAVGFDRPAPSFTIHLPSTSRHWPKASPSRIGVEVGRCGQHAVRRESPLPTTRLAPAADRREARRCDRHDDAQQPGIEIVAGYLAWPSRSLLRHCRHSR